jgi:O-succinylbenzoic acid--CoA ligase
MRVEAWLTRAARRRPDTEAVNGVSYVALAEAVDAGARDLHARGVGAGDRLAIALPPGTDFVVALHAAWRLGAVAVPVDLRWADAERDRLVAGMAFVDEPLEDGPHAALLGEHDLDAVAAVMHTSGSTGTPKPVALTFSNWLWSALGSGVALGVNPEERWLCPMPLSHVGGLSIPVRSAIYATTARILERWDTDRVLDELREATIVSLVPTTLQRLLDAGLEHGPRVLLGGAPIPPALREAPVEVIETYGLTEACSQVTTGGFPLFCTSVRVAPDGEIVVSGPTVAGDGELHTGDLGRRDADGRLHVTGRGADTIVTGGENVAPAEVEAVLEEHPAVAEAAVHARPDPEWGEALVATVVLRGEASEAALQAHVRERLAAYKVPKAIAFADALPRTPSGKLRRAELG